MESGTCVKLHPDLAAYLEPMPTFGQMLRHPLVYSVPYFGDMENERLNKLYEFRKADLAKAQADNAHNRWVFIHERPYRLSALLDLYGSIPDREFLPVMLDVYVDSENARANFDEWEDLLNPLTGTDPWSTLHAIPDQLTVYRGGVKEGFSWTTDLSVAEWFATRMGATGDIWQATVTKRDIVGYYDGRNEKEVIASFEAVRHLIEKYEN